MNDLSKTASTYLPKEEVQKIISDPEFPWLVSFPRTGSHWLRMMMELYFECPSLVRFFYYHNAKKYTCYHWHDEDLKVTGVKNVIYLYRDPVKTVYSQMNYYKEQLDDEKRIRYWAELYGKHLSKWLFEETFTCNKTILTYEGLQNDLQTEFVKLCAFFNTEFCPEKLTTSINRVTKEEVKIKTTHDLQIVNLTTHYSNKRKQFELNYGAMIYDYTYQQSNNLKSLF